MGWKVIFSKTSRADLFHIASYIAKDDPLTAKRFANNLLSRAESLATAPKMGVIYQRDGTARYIVHRSYLIIYDLEEKRQEIVVHRFWHGAQSTRPKLP